MDDWKQAANWLLQLGVVMPDHRIMSSTADTIDLLMNLRDGVLLCQLLNHLHPRAVNLLEINYSQGRTQMSQFLCIRNIRIFLQACSSVFEIDQKDLFEPMQLYEATDFKKVLYTLAKLSSSRLAIAKGARPFSIQVETSNIQEDIYADLQDNVDEVEDIYGASEDIYAPIEDGMDAGDDDIYDDLVNVRKDYKEKQALAQPAEKRDYCLNEIHETEGKYVEALIMIKNDFISPLKLHLTKEDKDKIFCNIEDLLRIHTEIYEQIQDCFFKSKPTIGSIFIQHRDKLLIYGDYVSKLTASQNHIDFLCGRDLKLKLLIETCQQKANQNRFNLRSLLSLPMQRMLKYHLLFTELNKKTDDSHKEKQEITAALQAMKDLSDFCNEVKRDYEHLETLQQIQKSLLNYNGEPIPNLGRLHLDGEVKVKVNNRKAVCGAAQKSCFLFDRALLVCNRGGKGLETHDFQYLIPLEHYEVDDSLPRGRGKWSFCFYLNAAKDAPQTQEWNSYEVSTKTADMMAKWVSSIQMAKTNIQPYNETLHTFVYYTFPHTKATYCSVCKKLLRGMHYQGYMCSDCKIPVHKECIRSSTSITCQRLDQQKTRPPRPSGSRANYEKTVVGGSGALNGGSLASNGQIPRAPGAVPQNMTSQPWYQDGINRDRANELLEQSPDGTFIIRFRDQKYALSIKFENVKHMRINMSGMGTYHLQESTTFDSITSLVDYYKQHPLNEVFTNLNTNLKFPFRDIEDAQRDRKDFIVLALAMYDFSARDIRELSLQRGDLVQVTIQPQSQRGWWKGRLHNKEGYFPASYVEIVDSH